MARPKGSKTKKAGAATGIDAQIAELGAQKLDLETAQAAIIASIAESNSLLKENKKEIKAVEKKILKLEAKKAEAETAAKVAEMEGEIQKRINALVADGSSLEDILEKLK